MFGDMMANMEEQQKAMKEKLSQIQLNAESGDGAVKVTVNANREVVNISINPQIVEEGDMEQVEDLLLVALNRALTLAAEAEAEESQKLIQNMLPPGLGNLGGMFQ